MDLKHYHYNRRFLIIAWLFFFLLSIGLILVYFFRWSIKDKQTVLSPQPTFSPRRLNPEEKKICQSVYQELASDTSQDYQVCFQPITSLTANCSPSTEPTGPLPKNLNIELILDASGSMAGTVPGGIKMAIAKQALIDFLDSIPVEAQVALRVYGHRGSNSREDKAVSCAGTELLYPFQKLDKESFLKTINSFSPNGWTPLADSLRKTREDFSQFNPATSLNLVYVVSDGIETCDGDPIAAAQELRSEAIQAELKIVGFAVDDQAQQQLKAMAQAGNGLYFEASSAQEMKDTFTEFAKRLSSINKSLSCLTKTAEEKRETFKQAAIQLRQCLSRAALKERDLALVLAKKQSQEKKISDDCWLMIYGLIWQKWSQVDSKAWSDFMKAEQEAWSDWILENNDAWQEWLQKKDTLYLEQFSD